MGVQHAQLERQKVVELRVLGEAHALISVHLALQALSHLVMVTVLAKVAQQAITNLNLGKQGVTLVELALSHLWLDQRSAMRVMLEATLSQEDFQVAMRAQQAHTKICKDNLVVKAVKRVLMHKHKA